MSLSSNNLSGPIPPELGSLSSLKGLFLHTNDLSGPIPPELGSLSSLERLLLATNDLSGPIPPALGNLSPLQQLVLSGNDLSGPIPTELGDLDSLRQLYLSFNDLSGPIPPGLGGLSSLERLYLNSNKLSGPIPPELGSLSSLEQFSLSVNRLSGPIPPELASLSSLQRLWLYSNDLSGPIPPEFGNLFSLELLRLESNGLEGPVPSELAGVSTLRVLRLSNNAGLSGLLPLSFTALSGLEELLAGGTDLCAPSDAEFLDWLASIYKLRLARCTDATVSTAYLTRAVQSREFPVPLLAGEEGLLRVFLTAAGPNSEGIPPVRATLYRDGTQVHQVEIPGKPGPIPTTVSEGDLGASANARIPAEVVRPGLEMVIEVDPEGTLDPGLGVVTRIPETGRLAVDVRAMPVLDLTLIPLLWAEKPEREVVDLIKAMAADPEGHDLLFETRLLLPVTGLSVKDHAPVTTSTNNTSRLLAEIDAIRIMEGGSGHYMGMMDRFEEWGGRARRPGRVSVSRPNTSTMAHELGHNMSLQLELPRFHGRLVSGVDGV